jgi:hypothetical protein
MKLALALNRILALGLELVALSRLSEAPARFHVTHEG